MAVRGGRRIGVAACATVALLALGAPPSGAHDSLAPRGMDYHRWLPHEHWVQKHWMPYDEARLRALLGVGTPTIYRWLEDDHRTLAQLARRRGVSPRTLGGRLLAPRRRELTPRAYRVLRERTERMLTQGHLAQHVYFHVFHGASITDPVQQWFGVSPARYRQLRYTRRLSPRQIAERHGRDPAAFRAHAASALEGEAQQGVHHGATSAEQANAMLARQLRVLGCWIDNPAPKFDPNNPFGDRYGGHGPHRRGSRVGIRHPKPARGCWRGLYSEE
jgi:hypothetical protein